MMLWSLLTGVELVIGTYNCQKLSKVEIINTYCKKAIKFEKNVTFVFDVYSLTTNLQGLYFQFFVALLHYLKFIVKVWSKSDFCQIEISYTKSHGKSTNQSV